MQRKKKTPVRFEWTNEPIDNPSWSLRTNETAKLYHKESDLPGGSWLAIQVVPIRLPPGPVVPYKGKTIPAEEHVAILACERDEKGRWQWLQLDAPTKVWFVDWLIDECQVDRDKWYFVGLCLTSEKPHDAGTQEPATAAVPVD